MARLRKLKLVEGSLVTRGANQHSHVVFFKRNSPAPAADERSLEQRLADLEWITNVNRADEAVRLAKFGDAVGARRIFIEHPAAYDAYMRSLRGETTLSAPVVKAAPAVDHRPAIRKLLADGAAGMTELGQLFRTEPGAYAAYQDMMATGETTEIAKRARREPADVGEAEKSVWKKRIKAWFAAKDHKALAAAKARHDPAFQAAWIDLVVAGEIKVAV